MRRMGEEGRRRGMRFKEVRQRRVEDYLMDLEPLFGELVEEREQRIEAGERFTVFLTYVDNLFTKSHGLSVLILQLLGLLKMLEGHYQVATQHVAMETARVVPSKPLTLENIINKFNCKTGGQNYNVVPEAFL